MRVAVLREFGTELSLEDRAVPKPRGEEAVVRVLGAGICRTDLRLIDGHYPIDLPRVLGHEIAGEAEGVGPVLVYGSWGCRNCAFCRRGEEQLCPDATLVGWERDGGYAEYVVVPSRDYLLPLGGLDPIRAAPLADAGVTPYRAVRRVRDWLQDGDWAVVIGVGGLGQFAIQYLKILTRARVLAVDVRESQLERARELGADEARKANDEIRSARVVLDFVGNDATLALASEVVEPAGIVVQVGEDQGTLAFSLSQVPYETHFTSSIWGSLSDLTAVLKLAQDGQIDWHVDVLPLSDVNEGLARLRRGDVLGRLVLNPRHG